jgi:hypothetical protein
VWCFRNYPADPINRAPERALSTPGQNLTLPPVENLTVRRGDELQFVGAS